MIYVLLSALGAGAGAWIAYLRWKDARHPEPLAVVAVAAMAGIVSVAAALGGYGFLDALGATASWGGLAGPWPRAVGVALIIGLAEEGAKLLAVVPIALWSRHFDELFDGIFYAGVAGIGFALAESASLLISGETGIGEALARAATTPITHALFAAPAGLGLAAAVLERRHWALPVGFAVSVAMHGAYDLCLARPGLQPVAAGVVLVLWIGLLVAARRLTARPKVAVR